MVLEEGALEERLLMEVQTQQFPDRSLSLIRDGVLVAGREPPDESRYVELELLLPLRRSVRPITLIVSFPPVRRLNTCSK